MKENTRHVVVYAILAVALAGGAGGLWRTLDHRDEALDLTAADRAPLVDETVNGRHQLRHPTFGFSFLHPGPDFAPSAALTAGMAKSNSDPHTIFYAYADSAMTTNLVLAVTGADVQSRERLQAELAGFERTFGASSGAAARLTVLERTVLWESGKHEADYHAQIGELHVRMRMLALHEKRAPALVAIMVMSNDPDALADMLASFTP